MVADVPDDERTKRRLGDATKGRIADLASGWSVDGDSEPAAPDPEPANATRNKPKTLPPPAPGSEARKQLEASIVDSNTPIPIAEPRTKPPTAPPRPKSQSNPPPLKPTSPLMKSGPTETGTVMRSGMIGGTPPPEKAAPTPLATPTSGPTTASGAIPISERSGSIIDSMPIPKSEPAIAPTKPIGTKSGPQSAIPSIVGTKSGSTSAIPESTSGPTAKGSVGTKSGPSSGVPESTSGPVSAKNATTASGPTKAASAPAASVKSGTDTKSGSVTAPPSGDVGKHSGSVAAIPDPKPQRSGPTRPPPPPPRPSGKTAPPPLPAVAARVESAQDSIDKLPLRPPDITDVSAPPSAVPPPIPSARPRLPSEEKLETIPEDQPGAMPKLVVPVGEFDIAHTMLEQEKLRIAYEQSTLKRDAANALLGMPDPAETVVKAPPVGVLLEETAQHLMRGDPTSIDSPSTSKFERGDPTLGPDSTLPSVGSASPAGRLRSGAALRRKRGIGGDLRYVATVLFGVRRARGELVELETRHDLRKNERRRHLVTLGRAAASLDGFDHPALGPARDQLADVEDERSQHAGAVAAADSELARVKRDRDTKAKQFVEEIVALDAELAEIAKKLEPLEKESTAIARKTGELRDALRRLDEKIKATEASQHSVRGKNTELANIQAEIATLKADRIAVSRDEPKIAAELDALHPRIAALEARRTELRGKRGELELDEKHDQRRTEELLAAIGAKRKVVDRATADAESVRDKILFELGERLYVDRSEDLAPQLSPIDDIDMDLGTGERRMMELREIISSVDKAKFVRGVMFALMILVVLGGITTAVLYLAL